MLNSLNGWGKMVYQGVTKYIKASGSLECYRKLKPGQNQPTSGTMKQAK